jgi:hypothetical protein
MWSKERKKVYTPWELIVPSIETRMTPFCRHTYSKNKVEMQLRYWRYSLAISLQKGVNKSFGKAVIVPVHIEDSDSGVDRL